MKLKTMLMALAVVILMPSLGAATSFDVDFTGNGRLDVFFVGHDISWGSIDSTTGTIDLGTRNDSLQVHCDFVICMEWINPYTVDRFVAVGHGSAEFDQSHELGGYGTSVESNSGIGVLWSRRVSSGTNSAFSTGALADSNFTISQYASDADPFTSVEVTFSNLVDDGLACSDVGFSEMLVSWYSNSLSSDLSDSLSGLSFDPVGLSLDLPPVWNGGSSVQLTSDYGFSLDILSLWQTPFIELEIISYVSE